MEVHAALRHQQGRHARAVFPGSQKGLKLDGSNPTLLYGYGGFEVSETPVYSAGVGRWVGQGAVYVLANIRGGGEYGPDWHKAALRENRIKAYEDFAAIAEDLIARKVTSTPHLGIQGGSNGGMLMGNMFVLYPQLFGAVVVQVPLLDMQRYSHLLAGASWMAEYGDPGRARRLGLHQDFSPYHNVRKDVDYPPVLFTTSTATTACTRARAQDDGAHEGAGPRRALLREHRGWPRRRANNEQAAFMQALSWTFLKQKLF
jgi:prolyl oligopeptidase